jgi:spore coat polysaccharide biosynthesis protein SpsF (cytidylyltransferase family)
MNGKTINERLSRLEELNKIEFVRKGERDYCVSEIKNKPNIYKLKYNQTSDEKDKKYKLLRMTKDTNPDVTYDNFEMMCSKVFNKDEIVGYFSMPNTILKYKYQKLVEI